MDGTYPQMSGLEEDTGFDQAGGSSSLVLFCSRELISCVVRLQFPCPRAAWELLRDPASTPLPVCIPDPPAWTHPEKQTLHRFIPSASRDFPWLKKSGRVSRTASWKAKCHQKSNWSYNELNVFGGAGRERRLELRRHCRDKGCRSPEPRKS